MPSTGKSFRNNHGQRNGVGVCRPQVTDANVFMESKVSDETVTKVALICDRVYGEKSDKRHGGAGTEAQIITPEIYQKKRQDKFVAVVREKDNEGNAHVPAYYKGRIFIDLSYETAYATQFENLVRWAWDKPLDTALRSQSANCVTDCRRAHRGSRLAYDFGRIDR